MSYFSRRRAVKGDVNATNLTASIVSTGSLTATGNVTAQRFFGDGSALTGIQTTSSGSLASADGYDVFVLLGQSNMLAYNPNEPRTPLIDFTDSSILQWGQNAGTGTANTPILASDPLEHPPSGNGAGNEVSSGSSLGMTFARMYKNATGRNVLLVPCAWPNTGFGLNINFPTATTIGNETVNRNWLATDPSNLLTLAIRRTNLAMAYHPVRNPSPAYVGTAPPTPDNANSLKAFLWQQGEFDMATTETAYKNNLMQLVQSLRTNVAAAASASPPTPFIAGYYAKTFLDGLAANLGKGPMIVMPQIGNPSYFLPACAFVSSLVPTVCPDHDGVHFTNAGYRTMGRRYYWALTKLVDARTIEPSVSAIDFLSTANDGAKTIRITHSSSVSQITLSVQSAGGGTSTLVVYECGAKTTFTVPATSFTNNAQHTITATPQTIHGTVGAPFTASVAVVPSVFNVETTRLAATTWRVSWLANNTTNVTLELAPASGSYQTLYSTSGSGLYDLTNLTEGATYTVRVTPYLNSTPGTPAILTFIVTDNLVFNLDLGGLSSIPSVDSQGKAITTTGTPLVFTDNTRGAVLSTELGHVTCASATVGTTYTKCCWVYIPSYPDTSYENFFSSSTSTGAFHYMYVNAKRVSVGHNTGGALVNVSDTGDLPLATWVHYAVTYSPSTTTMTLYKNGVSVATNTSYPAYAGGGDVQLGNIGSDGTPFRGYIDSARMYNRALSSSEVASMYQSEFVQSTTPDASTTMDNNLVFRLDLNGLSAMPSVDLTGKAIATGGSPAVVTGANNRGNVLSTVSGRVTCTSASLGPSYSKCCWIYLPGAYPSAAAGTDNFFSSSIVTNKYHVMYMNDSRQVACGHSGNNVIVQDVQTVPQLAWVHFAVTYNNSTGTMKLYRNGALAAMTTTAPAYESGGDVALGTIGTTRTVYFPGHLDDVRAYNRELSAYEVGAIYRSQAG